MLILVQMFYQEYLANFLINLSLFVGTPKILLVYLLKQNGTQYFQIKIKITTNYT